MCFAIVLCAFVLQTNAAAAGQAATVQVEVRSDGQPIGKADVTISGVSYATDAMGLVSASTSPGRVEIKVTKEGYAAVTTSVVVVAGQKQQVLVELDEAPTLEEEVVVSATRTNKRVEDQPMRVEVVPGEEVQEKIMMTPGDVSMLLNETNGLRVQTTSPSLGGATVRIQGLRGRYTQVLADGLPLYGGQTGSIGLLQIPPMDLGQVEVIKGAASALYGMSAIGGVVNLVSRRPPARDREAELLINRTSHAGTDIVACSSRTS
jgi:outer membrane receptor for ferrienterochelin and colicins